MRTIEPRMRMLMDFDPTQVKYVHTVPSDSVADYLADGWKLIAAPQGGKDSSGKAYFTCCLGWFGDKMPPDRECDSWQDTILSDVGIDVLIDRSIKDDNL
jgi:hypothetical protein